MRKINLKKVIKYIAIGFTACFAITSIIAKLKKNGYVSTYKNSRGRYQLTDKAKYLVKELQKLQGEKVK